MRMQDRLVRSQLIAGSIGLLLALPLWAFDDRPWLAAVLALALGLGWQLRPGDQPPVPAAVSPAPASDIIGPGTGAPLVVVAEAMTREYRGALRELPAPRPATPGYSSLLELDANAAAVREALAQDPDAVFLLQRLQHIHARRLALTRQLASA